ncbi:Delta(14)-sterol reductase [Diaporthe helianthi]|uniref:Delta(14)-sterol reductase n=1 Tax=Diaporthe helianthi TaxID=158607 RepID=A0A2P5I4C0_DIAHE|nr:Delta(14)-sterol reductase [Diaporthe helianthi]
MAPNNKKPDYEFGGPPGAAAIVFGLPVLLNVWYLGCNGISGCPAPALLQPSTLTWEGLKAEIPWPERGIWGFASWEATSWTVLYYLLSLALYRLLPANEVYGTKLRESGRPLLYRFNAFHASVAQLAACAVGTYLYGAEWAVWSFITDNYLQLLTANIILAYAISIYVYARSFEVQVVGGNCGLRELAVGGHTGSFIYDFYIGRELNPRVTLSLAGEVDLKAWLEMRPGLTGWVLLDLAFVAQQYRTDGRLSDSIVVTAAVQTFYVLYGQYAEHRLLGMMDIITDGLGFMLTFGDMVWVPFLYSTQCRYLAVHPVQLGWAGLAAAGVVFVLGLYVFRASNLQKSVFRRNPEDPSVRAMSYIQTKRGKRLLAGGWWGVSRHINYFGDWLQALPFSLPTGMAGYVMLPPARSVVAASAGAGESVSVMLDGRQVIQGAAKGWGMVFTYFYVVYFAILLIHRERRDDKACSDKYGEDWDEYKRTVRWRIVPYVY